MMKQSKPCALKYIVGIVMICAGCAAAIVSTIMSYLMLKDD